MNYLHFNLLQSGCYYGGLEKVGGLEYEIERHSIGTINGRMAREDNNEFQIEEK